MAEAEAQDRESGVWDMKASQPVTATEADFHHLLGSHVRLHSLQARAELNGCIGRCYSWDAEVGRAGIRILLGGGSNTNKMLSIKPTNLTVLADDEAATLLASAVPLPALPTISKDDEFYGNVTFDRFALYLRPLDAYGQHLTVSGASDTQERWGGLHCTLCSFAPAHDSGAPQMHSSAVLVALERAVSAVKAAASPGASRWTVAKDASLCYSRRMIELPDDASLKALCTAVAVAGMCSARKAETLHISVGEAEGGEAARAALLACGRWEVCVAKCAAGVEPLRVSEIVERMELVWDEAVPVA